VASVTASLLEILTTAVLFEYATLVDCGVFHETAAPGVGTIEFYSSWDGTSQLQSYLIVPEPATSLHLLITAIVGAVGYCSAFRARIRSNNVL
jgi:hypothetical protein